MGKLLISVLALFSFSVISLSLSAEEAPQQKTDQQSSADASAKSGGNTGTLPAKKELGKREEQRKKILQQYDENKNGRLDPAERAKLLRDRRAAAGRSKQSGTRQQLNPYQAQILKQYDTNKDGQLDAKEIAKARQDMMKRQQQMMRQLQQRFRRGRGGRGGARRGGGGRRGYGGGRGGNPLQRLMQMRQRYLQQLLKQRQQQQQGNSRKR